MLSPNRMTSRTITGILILYEDDYIGTHGTRGDGNGTRRRWPEQARYELGPG